ncbi:hypothetical protein GJU40_16965 [Bacillus lacus]|uniref:DUF4083 domain-containing protein n=1 Tax=Metabacillus lacus TaxID=1983721 RepID=A0A7X2LZV1_9BACI|nr:hypothetical protein [Metabacillus lacus]MRX73836.1 hypothetical protein [Metabacillus lacus]
MNPGDAFFQLAMVIFLAMVIAVPFLFWKTWRKRQTQLDRIEEKLDKLEKRQ